MELDKKDFGKGGLVVYIDEIDMDSLSCVSTIRGFSNLVNIKKLIFINTSKDKDLNARGNNVLVICDDKNLPYLINNIHNSKRLYTIVRNKREETISKVWSFLTDNELPLMLEYLRDVLEMRIASNANNFVVRDISRYVAISNYSVPCINLSYYIKELGSSLAEFTEFVVIWNIKDDKVRFNLVSNGKFNTRLITNKFNGTGSENISGFTIPLKDFDMVKFEKENIIELPGYEKV